MKVQQQVCGLELAKGLKELGVKQESYFYWIGDIRTDKDCRLVVNRESPLVVSRLNILHFTVAELGEMLQKGTELPYKHRGNGGRENDLPK